MNRYSINIMTDIETLGKDSDCLVFQIAAAKFILQTGEIIETFNETVNINNSKFTVDGGTLLWWLKTDKELLTKLLMNPTVTDETELFCKFNKWIRHLKSLNYKLEYLWGNGILFDNKIIESKMKKYGIKYPIFYRNDRDMRTLVEAAACKVGIESEKEFREKYITDEYKSHDAFDDVRFQIMVVSKAWNILMEK